MNFVANIPYLKMVNVYKNDELIYTESYEYEDEVNTFIYSHNDTSNTVIPDDKYYITVETFEEYVLAKGFPENDTVVGDIYDHDSSLDDFGELYDIPRKKYTYTDTTNPANTEPAYNNRLTEDDYHYMNRILIYLSHIHDTPLPVLEVWKLFSIPLDEITLINRERYLCKMYSREKHGGDDWTPKPWEHKDTMSCFKPEPIFFFVEVDNHTPVLGQTVNFTFTFMNMFGEDKGSDYLINVYYNDTLIAEGVNPANKYSFNTTDVEEDELVFRFEAIPFDTHLETLMSDDIILTLKGCNTADWYVSLGGDDNNPGTKDYPFYSLERALSAVEGSKNTIVLVEGTFRISHEYTISSATSIISCRNAIIRNDDNYDFFKVLPNASLYLQGILLKHKCCEMHGVDDDFFNLNVTNNPIYLRVNKDLMCKDPVILRVGNVDKTIYAHTSFTVTGVLLDENTYEPVEGETVELITGDTTVESVVTDEDGEFSFTEQIDVVGNNTFVLNHAESNDYCTADTGFTVTSVAMPGVLTATMDNIVVMGEALNVGYGLTNYYGEDISTGSVSLVEDGDVVQTVMVGEDFDYVPTTLGEHTYLVRYGGDNTYNVPDSEAFTVTVRKINPVFIMSSEHTSYGTSETITLDGTLVTEYDEPIADATVKLYDGSTLIDSYTTDSDGEVSASLTLLEGKHNLQWKYEGSTGFNPSDSNVLLIRVYDDSTTPEINLLLSASSYFVGSDTVDLTVHATDDEGNPIETSFKILDSSVNSCENLPSTTYTTNSSGVWTGTYTNSLLEDCEGIYLQAVSAVDTNIYSNSIHVVYDGGVGLHLLADNVTKYEGNSLGFVVTVVENGTPVSGKSVAITFNGVTYNRTSGSDGTCSLPLNVAPGVYPISATCEDASINRTVTILSRFIDSAVTKYEKGSENYECTILDTDGVPLAQGTSVTVSIGGDSDSYTTDSNGKITVPLNQAPGEYVITVAHSQQMHSSPVTILGRLIASDLTKYDHCGEQFNVEVLDSTGQPVTDGTTVTLNVDGVNYNRSTQNGVATLNINLNPGTYGVTTSYDSVTPINNTIIVLPRLSGEDVEMVYKDGSVFEAMLIDCTGVPMAGETLTFSINGVRYDRTTGSNGVASLLINLMPGEYIITTYYSNIAAMSNVIKINSDPGLTFTSSASANTVYVGDTVSFNASLKDSGVGVSGEVLDYEISSGGTVLDSGTVTTDSNGSASVSYTGTGAGSVTCTFSVGSLSTSKTISDLTHAYNITVSATPSTIRAGETSTIYATLTDNGNPVVGVNVLFTVGGTSISTTTAGGGVASTQYVGTGAGSVSVSAVYDSVSATTTIADNPAVSPDAIVLSGSASIIQTGGSATVTATLKEGSSVCPGFVLSYQIEHNGTVISSGSDTTDSNGQISISYTGTGVGDVDVVVTYMSLQEIFVLEDLIDYQPMTSNIHQSRWNIPSAVTRSSIFGYSSNGWKFGNASSYSTISAVNSVNTPYSMEFTLTDKHNGAETPAPIFGAYLGSNYIMCNTKPNSLEINVQGSIQSYSLTYTLPCTIRYELTANTVSVYVDDVLVGSRTHSLTGNPVPTFQTSSNRYCVIKDYKIKAL